MGKWDDAHKDIYLLCSCQVFHGWHDEVSPLFHGMHHDPSESAGARNGLQGDPSTLLLSSLFMNVYVIKRGSIKTEKKRRQKRSRRRRWKLFPSHDPSRDFGRLKQTTFLLLLHLHAAFLVLFSEKTFRLHLVFLRGRHEKDMHASAESPQTNS